tara:strand:- start:164 stop:976 length:813 start_codon:yes stop_codon:yes gene_type:complete
MEPEPVPGYSIHQTPTGDFYYVNKKTGESQWDRPPPDHTQPPQPPMPTPGGQELPAISGSVPRPFASGVEGDEGSELKFAKGAILLIIVSLFMPYVSVADGLIEATGVDIIVESIELLDYLTDIEPDELAGIGEECPYANDGVCDEPFLCETGTDGDDCGGTDSGEDSDIDIPIRYFMIIIGALMVLFSPFFFLLSGIISSLSVFLGDKIPKIMGWIHLGYFVIMFLMLAIGQTVLDSWLGAGDLSLVEFLGAGIWVGGLASIGLFYEKS